MRVRKSHKSPQPAGGSDKARRAQGAQGAVHRQLFGREGGPRIKRACSTKKIAKSLRGAAGTSPAGPSQVGLTSTPPCLTGTFWAHSAHGWMDGVAMEEVGPSCPGAGRVTRCSQPLSKRGARRPPAQPLTEQGLVDLRRVHPLLRLHASIAVQQQVGAGHVGAVEGA